ncbi:MAG: class I SAM-dependent methyltransferase, partial [Imperialibacter sp.]
MQISDLTIKGLFEGDVSLAANFIQVNFETIESAENHEQTKTIFSDKWIQASRYESISKLFDFQRDWFLKLYGFETELALKEFLADKKTILDTGCGLGYKAEWFARLAPHATVIGIDISDAVYEAARNYTSVENLFFYKGDIANTGLRDGSVDFMVCDQVIMHTENPEQTFRHLTNKTSATGQFACYVYSKKALPRELVDDHFRKATHQISNDKMWEFSNQLTELGKRLSELNVSFESPDIPLLGIKGGKYDIQRFIYWNFLKCFWKEDWGFE